MLTRQWCSVCETIAVDACSNGYHDNEISKCYCVRPVVIVDGSDSLEKVEEQLMLLALDYAKQNRTHAAESLGISTRTLQRKLKRMGVQ